MKTLRKLPIRKQLGLVTYFPAIFLFAVLTINSLALRQSDSDRHAQQYTTLLSTIFSSTLIDATDESSRLIKIKELSDHVLSKNPDILAIEIVNGQGQGVTTHQHANLDQGSPEMFHSISVSDSNNSQVGVIRVALNDNSAQNLLMANLSVAILAALLCVFFTRKTTSCALRRMARVRDTLNQIAAGNISVRINYPYNNEFGQFATKFNQVLDKLEESIEQRDQSYKELLASKNVVDRVVAEKTDFVGRFCAAFRVPLNHLIGDISLAIDVPTHEQRSMLDESVECLRDLRRFTDDLQSFSDIEFGSIQLKSRPIKLSECIEQTLTCYIPDCKTRKISVETVFSGDAWSTEVIADPLRLSQIVHCLMTKAVHHAERGKIFVRVNAHDTGDHRTSVILDVTDSGPGIEPSFVEEMNEAFHQHEKEYRTYSPDRPCLSLALADKLSSLMDGQLSVRSKLGVGTTLSCDLVFKHSLEPTKLQPRYTNTSDSVRAIIHQCTEIPLFKEILSIKSIDANFIDSEFNAQTVSEFDIAIVDLSRPDGLSFAHQLRQSFPQMPLIAVISQDQQQEVDIYRFDLSAVIEKPIRRFDVMQAVRNHFIVANKISSVAKETTL